MKSKKKRFKLKLSFTIVAFWFIYLIIGSIVPHVYHKEVSDSYKNQFNTNKYIPDLTSKELESNHSSKKSYDRAMLLETNKSALDERMRLIGISKESIIISTFNIQIDDSGMDVISALFDAAGRGIKIKVLVDGFSSMTKMEGNDYFYALSNHPNIEIKIYNKINFFYPWKLQGRLHDKYMIVDDIAYILGGRNIYNKFLGEYPGKQSYDREVLVYNTANHTMESKESSVAVLKEYFESVWNLECCTYFQDYILVTSRSKVKRKIDLLKEHYKKFVEKRSDLYKVYDYETMTEETKMVSLLSNPTGIYGKEPTLFYSLIQLMKQAKNDVVIHTPYVAFDKNMYDEITELCKSDATISIVVNSVANGDNLPVLSDYLQNKQDVLDTGILLYEYDGGLSYHGKTITIDNHISMIGSFNFDMRSVYINTELMVVIDSKQLNKRLRAYMDEIQKKSRRAVTEDEYETPEGWINTEIDRTKRLKMEVMGTVMRFFRFLL